MAAHAKVHLSIWSLLLQLLFTATPSGFVAQMQFLFWITGSPISSYFHADGECILNWNADVLLRIYVSRHHNNYRDTNLAQPNVVLVCLHRNWDRLKCINAVTFARCNWTMLHSPNESEIAKEIICNATSFDIPIFCDHTRKCSNVNWTTRT